MTAGSFVLWFDRWWVWMTGKGSCSEFIKQLEQEAENRLHKRILRAYSEDSSVKAMEDELSKALLEVVNRAD